MILAIIKCKVLKMKFALQNIITDYSFYNSLINEEKLVNYLKNNDIDGAIITDFNKLNGVFSYSSAFKKENLKFGIGFKSNVTFKNRNFDATIIIMNNEGYKIALNKYQEIINNNFDLNNIDNFFSCFSLIVNFDEVTNKNLDENFLNSLKQNNLNFYIGLNFENAKRYSLNFQTIIDQPICFLFEEEKNAFEYLQKLKKEDSSNINFDNCLYPQYDDIYKTFDEQTIKNSLNLINKLNFDPSFIKGELPNQTHDDFTTLKNLVYENLKLKNLQKEEYIKRVEYELDIIDKTSFATYFLIIHDIIKIAYENDILIGPGRGSSASSLVAFLLDITKVDPIIYNLTFSRFLNVKRANPPDIDIDVEDDQRGKLIDLLKEKYTNLSHIRTYTTFKCKSVLKALFNIFPISEYQQKLLLNSLSSHITNFQDEYKTNQRFKSLIDSSDKTYLNIIQIATKLLNVRINTSIHPAGIIINKDRLQDLVPIFSENNIDIVQVEYPELENHNFLKIDLLALSNLSFITKIKQEIVNIYYKDNDKNKIIEKLKFENIPLDDEKTFQVLNKLHLANIFQLISYGIKEVIKKDEITNFNDLVNLLALYRPGPLDHIDTYIRNKQNKYAIKYKNEKLEAILKDTYNTIIYQEQIIAIANKLANFSEEESDLFRRAISKKDIKKMQIYKNLFIENLIKYSKYAKNDAIVLYDTIEQFAQYGFNKAHSVSYSLITYTLLYFKANFPKAFYKVSLDEEQLGGENFLRLNKEMTNRKLFIKQVNVNKSLFNKYNVINDNFYLPVKFIKNISFDATCLENIIAERKKNFTKLEQFLYVLKTNNFELLLTALINSGFLDEIIKSRYSLLTNLSKLKLFYEFQTSPDDEFNYDNIHIDDSIKMEIFLKEKETMKLFLSSNLKTMFNLKDYKEHLYVVYSDFTYAENYYKVRLIDELNEIEVKIKQRPDLNIKPRCVVYLEKINQTNNQIKFFNFYNSIKLVKAITKQN